MIAGVAPRLALASSGSVGVGLTTRAAIGVPREAGAYEPACLRISDEVLTTNRGSADPRSRLEEHDRPFSDTCSFNKTRDARALVSVPPRLKRLVDHRASHPSSLQFNSSAAAPSDLGTSRLC